MPEFSAKQSINQSKASIRQQFRQTRNRLSQAFIYQSGQALAEKISQSSAYLGASRIACFLSFDAEIDTAPLIRMILKEGKSCFLPKIRPTKPNRLWFMPYTASSKLANNRYGIEEVDLAVNFSQPVSSLDIIFMPLVAFDNKGNRLGMGGGYYDATLAHLVGKSSASKKSKRPLCIGLAYEQQKLVQLPSQAWDFPLDAVFTQKTSYWFNK